MVWLSKVHTVKRHWRILEGTWAHFCTWDSWFLLFVSLCTSINCTRCRPNFIWPYITKHCWSWMKISRNAQFPIKIGWIGDDYMHRIRTTPFKNQFQTFSRYQTHLLPAIKSIFAWINQISNLCFHLIFYVKLEGQILVD